MSDKAYVGIEFGDLELRAAYITDSEPEELPLPIDISSPQILFEPYSETSTIGVGFPTVSQKLGTQMSFAHMSLRMNQELRASKLEQSLETPESMLTRALATINQGLFKVTGKSIGGAVIAVPATMRQNGRKALLDCARNAGFGEVSLIDRCTAAALSYHRNYTDKSTTAVVYDLGYGNCEYALLRLAGERCRVMNSGAVAEVSGEALDAVVIEAFVLALRKKKIFLGLKHFTPLQWQELKHLVAHVRITIAENKEASITLIPKLTGLDRTMKFQYASEPFKARLGPLINKTIDGVHGILEQSALELADIDTILLVGSSAGMSPVYDMLSEAFDRKATRTEPTIIAYGAAWHASQRAKNSAERVDLESQEPPGQINANPTETEHVSPLVEDNSEAESGSVMFVDGEDGAYEQAQTKQGTALVINADMSFYVARKLIEQGRTEEAALLLEDMSTEVANLRSKLNRDEKSDVSRMLIQQALSLVESGYDLHRAVELTHRAYHQAPDEPDVFEGMLKVHTQAALQMGSPEEYESSIRILLCALSHDQTDRSIRQALAERYYKHAVAVRKVSDSSKVFEIVDKALAFDAKHVGLNQLHKELAIEVSNTNSPQQKTAESN
jgi:actin-like ATPase involved in cell morphogenesis